MAKCCILIRGHIETPMPIASAGVATRSQKLPRAAQTVQLFYKKLTLFQLNFDIIQSDIIQLNRHKKDTIIFELSMGNSEYFNCRLSNDGQPGLTSPQAHVHNADPIPNT